ncbi:hypothetical protein D9M71_246040 [compost metagenome]
MPHHCAVRKRSLGKTQCRPKAVNIGAVYKNTDMCAADVSCNPSAISRNSRANRPPASRPARQVLA